MFNIKKAFFFLGVVTLFSNNTQELASKGLDSFLKESCAYFSKKYGVEFNYKLVDVEPKISKIFVVFDHNSTPSKEEAIFLPIRIATDLLKSLNQSKELSPYLEENPFPAEALSVEVLYARKDITDVYSASYRGTRLVIHHSDGENPIKETYNSYLISDGRALAECEKVVEILK